MLNLTTGSLEPAPLSSGWKSGSLPTGFTPTILGEPGQGGRDAAGFKPDGGAVPGEAQAWTEEAAAAVSSLRGALSVPSHARERSGRGGGAEGTIASTPAQASTASI